MSAGDVLLLSANLAPGPDFLAGVRTVLPLYDNALTNDWLMTFLLDIGFEKTDGVLEWRIESCPGGNDLLRIEAWFHVRRPRVLKILGETFEFSSGEKIRLFFSYRYTPERVRAQLGAYGIAVHEQWITSSGEEGVFLCGPS
jgi:hypothetical protein